MGLRGIEELHVKPGEQVCYIPPYPLGNWERNWKILPVVKVTPAGQIVLPNGRRFDKEGYGIGDRGVIRLLTEELRTRMELAQNIELLENFKWREIDAKTASDVITVLKLNGAID